jgi:hypothetical protein
MDLFCFHSQLVGRRTLTASDRMLIKSAGKYSCVGKQLGLMEIRQVTTQIMRRYNVEFAPSQDPKGYTDGLQDTFTTALPPLKLVFTDRVKDGKA